MWPFVPYAEDILQHDLRMQFRLHRRVFLDAVAKLRVRSRTKATALLHAAAAFLQHARRACQCVPCKQRGHTHGGYGTPLASVD